MNFCMDPWCPVCIWMCDPTCEFCHPDEDEEERDDDCGD